MNPPVNSTSIINIIKNNYQDMYTYKVYMFIVEGGEYSALAFAVGMIAMFAAIILKVVIPKIDDHWGRYTWRAIFARRAVYRSLWAIVAPWKLLDSRLWIMEDLARVAEWIDRLPADPQISHIECGLMEHWRLMADGGSIHFACSWCCDKYLVVPYKGRAGIRSFYRIIDWIIEAPESVGYVYLTIQPCPKEALCFTWGGESVSVTYRRHHADGTTETRPVANVRRTRK